MKQRTSVNKTGARSPPSSGLPKTSKKETANTKVSATPRKKLVKKVSPSNTADQKEPKKVARTGVHKEVADQSEVVDHKDAIAQEHKDTEHKEDEHHEEAHVEHTEEHTEESDAEKATIEDKHTETPVVDETSVVEEPVAEEPIAEEPAIETSVDEEPAVEEPAVKETVVEDPIVEETVVATEEPVTEVVKASNEEEEAVSVIVSDTVEDEQKEPSHHDAEVAAITQPIAKPQMASLRSRFENINNNTIHNQLHPTNSKELRSKSPNRIADMINRFTSN